MGAKLHANGAMLLRELRLPGFRNHAQGVSGPGAVQASDTGVLGIFLRDVIRMNPGNFALFGPDETICDQLQAVFETSNRQWAARTLPSDELHAPSGRVLEILSEHQCEGWLEGHLLTGRHGLFNCYEAFIHIIDSMFNTSVGFSPLERLVMASRCGDIDAAVVPYLAGRLELYCYRICKYIGAYLMVLGGCDGIVFGGGVGEHVPQICRRVLAGLSWAGVELDAAANAAAVGHEGRISTEDSAIAVWTVAVQEEPLLARAAARAIGADG